MIYIFANEVGFAIFPYGSSSSFISLSSTLFLLWSSLIGFIFESSNFFSISFRHTLFYHGFLDTASPLAKRAILDNNLSDWVLSKSDP